VFYFVRIYYEHNKLKIIIYFYFFNSIFSLLIVQGIISLYNFSCLVMISTCVAPTIFRLTALMCVRQALYLCLLECCWFLRVCVCVCICICIDMHMEMAEAACDCVCVGAGLPSIMYACVLGKKRQSFLPCRRTKRVCGECTEQN